MVEGEIFPGFPFNEGGPRNLGTSCELILLDGGRVIARHRAGQWTTQSGRIVSVDVVAAWKTVDTEHFRGA
ncbi:MAG: hypothetical protein AAB534_01970 [Patescibacteria group bacterium]